MLAWLLVGRAGHSCFVALIRRSQVLREVGRRVAELRIERGLTQEELAVRIGITDRYLRYIEAGRINLSLGYLVRLANALGVPIASFLERPRARPARSKRRAARS